MKAFAFGRRAKWKDYVDLYFILRDYYSIAEICTEAKKLFREQLAFHNDIDFTEPVEYLAQAVADDDIKIFSLTQQLIFGITFGLDSSRMYKKQFEIIQIICAIVSI